MLWVTDGDTLTVLGPGNAQYQVDLAGIDAPELGQRYGQTSKARLSRLVTGYFVLVDWQERDPYKRFVGKVLMSGQDVGLEQLRAGLAWHCDRYQHDQTPREREAYAQAEEEAQEAHRGLWADDDPISPWDWRGGKRSVPAVTEVPDPATSPLVPSGTGGRQTGARR